ncbi:TadE/TadG family type IV pilus assembly protein [Thalassovita sp.]|uniref:TadE/TadG family type IV pilus assembly protein n=1 Tax=Thalassovita sp. TaxID=1979401 RepID=UPI002B274F42|nr:TadE/TadG family type IV pilus assembly protein [Thalassovita sp.]
MTMFAIFAFICMLMVAGIGIDLMRYERDRAKLQNTLDRAVLAAADMDQTADANSVVTDYFTKAGIAEYLTNVSVEEGLGYKSVNATAQSHLSTNFLSLVGINELTAPASGGAAESIGSVEISLVLDVSGSMGSNSRLARLKPAAIEFVDAILDASSSGTASISIIPYAMQVNAGRSILEEYTTTAEHDYSHCVNFNDDQFSSSSVSQTEMLELTGHFDVWPRVSSRDQYWVCPIADYAQILPLSNDKNLLHERINALQAKGNTSIDIGLKWGSLLLDPSTRPVVNALINKNVVDADFTDRPVAYDDDTTLKIIVLMTDGQNTDQYMLNPSMRDGLSDVWYKPVTGDTNGNGYRDTGEFDFDSEHYSVQHSNGNSTEYWWPSANNWYGDWYDHPYGNGSYQQCSYWSGCNTVEEPGDAVQLTYPELFNQVSLAYNADINHSYQGNRWSTWFTNAYSKKDASAKDQRARHVCNAAKDQGVVVFTIGFEAPRRGQRLLERCASSASHHFDVNGLDISDAFESIAASISKLRLTQ